MPARATLKGAAPVISRSSNVTEPERALTRPMTVFKVVLLPMPFRPSKATSSPWATSRLIPCSTWLAP